MVIADRCLALMREHHTAAIPRNYELFYRYAAGDDGALTAAFEPILKRPQPISAEETDQLYEDFIASRRVDKQVDDVGDSLSGEIGAILELVHSARDSTEAFSEALMRAGAQLSSVSDPEQFKSFVQTLVGATRKMAQNSQSLKSRLAASKAQISELQANLEQMRLESSTDPLTNLANRKRFDQILTQQMREADRTDSPLCLLLIDIDDFKGFNDHFGHQTGDGVLKLVSRAMQAQVKGRDLVARYGGEEFAIIMPRTVLQNAIAVAEQIRRSVMGKELVRKSTGQTLGRITLSIGVACYKYGETAQGFIHRADASLYIAKHGGRNRVKSEQDQDAKDGLNAA